MSYSSQKFSAYQRDQYSHEPIPIRTKTSTISLEGAHICQVVRSFCSRETIYLPVNQITSIKVYIKSPKKLLYAAILLLFVAAFCLICAPKTWAAGLAAFFPAIILICGITAVVLFLLFLLNRLHGAVIATASEKIKIELSVFRREQLLDFVDAVLAAGGKTRREQMPRKWRRTEKFNLN